MTTFIVTGFSLILTVAICIGSTQIAPELGPGFELSQNIGPVYWEYNTRVPYKSSFLKAALNTQWWYVNGEWSLNAPGPGFIPLITNDGGLISGKVFVNEDTIDLYTNNCFYPLLKNQPIPLDKTFLGNFETGFSLARDRTTYLSHLGEGTLDIYSYSRSDIVHLTERKNELSWALMTWYASWMDLPEFSIYKSFYLPWDRRGSTTWLELTEIFKISYPHPSIIPIDEAWELSSTTLKFSTIDFFQTDNKVSLYDHDSMWGLLTAEEAMFRYYDIETGEIGFWTPKDLILSKEIDNIAALTGRKPEELLIVFINWLSDSARCDLYFNFIATESFDWANDPKYDIQYVF